MKKYTKEEVRNILGKNANAARLRNPIVQALSKLEVGEAIEVTKKAQNQLTFFKKLNPHVKIISRKIQGKGGKLLFICKSKAKTSA